MERKDFLQFAINKNIWHTLCMVPDELPLSDGISKTHKTLSVVDLQKTIAENIATLIWYTPTNELLIRFINEFWDHDQLTCLVDRELSDDTFLINIYIIPIKKIDCKNHGLGNCIYWLCLSCRSDPRKQREIESSREKLNQYGKYYPPCSRTYSKRKWRPRTTIPRIRI